MSPSFNNSSQRSRFGLRAAVLVAVWAIAAPVASASTAVHESFSGKPCSLFTASQVAQIVGDSNTGKYKCVPGKSVTTPAGTNYTAKAGSGTTTGGGFFSILVVKYKSASIENLAKKQVAKGLNPVKGIGDWAYAKIGMSPAVGGNVDAGELVFGAKGYGVEMTARAKLKQKVNQPALKALAKKIAGEL